MTSQAVLYLRQSDDRAKDAASVERQEKACRALAEARGWTVAGVHRDVGISAYSGKDRPGWRAVLADIEAERVQVVVSWHTDRMARNMRDLESLIDLCEKHNVLVATATGDLDLTTDSGRMTARILAAVARGEVERKGARQRMANADRRSKGLPNVATRRRRGYTKDGMSIVEDEAEQIRTAVQAVLNGESIGQIARDWGVSPGTVLNTLKHPIYAGLMVHDGKVVGKGTWPPILDEMTHRRIVRFLSDPDRKKGWPGPVARNLLTGIGTCTTCERTMQVNPLANGTPRYRCKKGHVSVPVKLADEVVRAWFLMMYGQGLESLAAKPPDTTKAERELADVDRELAEVAEDRVAGLITREQSHIMTARLTDKRDRITARLRDADTIAPPVIPDWRAFQGRAAEYWDSLTLRQRRAIVKYWFTVKLSGLGKARRWDKATTDDVDRCINVRVRTT